MNPSTLDAIVQPIADKLAQQDIDLAKQEIDLRIHHSDWNMNQRLNMIAYEDQT